MTDFPFLDELFLYHVEKTVVTAAGSRHGLLVVKKK